MPHVDIGTHRLWVTDKGSGPPVLFVHGLFLDGRMFEAQADALHDRYRTLAVDVRDHGRSEGPARDWTLWEAAGDLFRLLDELGIGRVHWVGLSMGGMIGLRFALKHPDKLLSLSLLDTTAHSEPRALLHKAMARSVDVGGRPAARVLMPYVLKQMFSPEGRSSEAAEVWTERILSMDTDALVRSAMAVFDRGSLADRLHEIEVPSLVVVGEEDQATPPSHAERLAKGLPDATFERIPNAGHLTPLEAPDAVTDALDGFLRHATATTAPQG